ncbi:metallophosphoesterase [Paraburkholderia sp. A3BS-1L]|uniref:metallophosphoesterase n=1 Tax=Paraburkholderia sp. A3BS-1L TaxID=3028375 RepID=UPI003DAA17E9
MNYDIIGDIHGQVGKLRALLEKLGYRERKRAWWQAGRQAIFVGDFIDRGPHQVETIKLVRRMIDAGNALAVMGNHEFNAIAWSLSDPSAHGDFLRTHQGELGAKNFHQHRAFLEEVKSRPRLHKHFIDWFLTLPLWLDLPGLRVVHACWHHGYMAEVAPRLKPGHTLDESLMVAASRECSMEFRTIEGLTKGLEIDLPNGHVFLDKDEIKRRRVRLRWWDASATTYKAAAMIDAEARARLPDMPIPKGSIPGYTADKPVFFGHYWLTGTPKLQSSTVACVDYSAGKGGPLVAYRWEGETELDAGHFVCSN